MSCSPNQDRRAKSFEIAGKPLKIASVEAQFLTKLRPCLRRGVGSGKYGIHRIARVMYMREKTMITTQIITGIIKRIRLSINLSKEIPSFGYNSYMCQGDGPLPDTRVGKSDQPSTK